MITALPLQLAQQVLVLPQRRTGRDDDRRLPLVVVLQSREAWGRDIPTDRPSDILSRFAAVEHQRVQAGPAVRGKFVEPLANLLMKCTGDLLHRPGG